MSKDGRGEARGAPTTDKRRRLRREAILGEATRLFSERGYEGASMGELAERVGLRKASLFHHFPSKEALYATVLTELLDAVRSAIVAAQAAEGSFESRLDALTDALTATLGREPYAARILLREVMDSGARIGERFGPTIEDVLAAALEFARAGQRAGAFAAELDPLHVIVSLVGVHVMPFAIGDLVERFTGKSPFAASFVEERRQAVREQVRRMILRR